MAEHPTVDVLAIAAHRDDVEQTCGGTLLRMRSLGVSTAILDLTQGEAGTRGSAQDRGAEAAAAARILGVQSREALDIPDGRVENTWDNRLKVVEVLRRIRPRVVILPYWTGRHPDHYTSSTLGYEACFLSGLAKIETGTPPHRPFKIIYASLYADVRRRHHAIHRGPPSRANGLHLAIRESVRRQWTVCTRGRNSRAHIL
jgi:bacillithiol biosynthesis deacetylase BshB1